MKNVLYVLLLTTVLVGASSLKSAEIIPVWNTTVEGEIKDMEFLKGQNEILMLVGEGSKGQIQRRNPDNGDLIHSLPEFISDFSKLSITPDSLRFVQINGIDGVLRNIDENYTKGNTFSLQQMQEDSVIIYFTNIAVDPIRPFAYLTTFGWNKNINQYAPRGKVIAYNYETGEHIKDLTPYGEYEYSAIEVSADGRYLATLNDNKAYLKVWDLNTMEQILNEPLFDNSDDWCFAEDIYFSKLNQNVIYYSGNFTKKLNSKDIYPPSMYTFNIKTKTKELLLPNEIYGGYEMIFFDSETKILSSDGGVIGIMDLITEKLEWYGFPPKNVYSNYIIYNAKEKYFLGVGDKGISKFIFDSQSSIEIGYDVEIRITPNPTNSSVSINLECTEPIINYQIYDINGNSLIQSTIENHIGDLQFDFTDYLSGVYFLTIQCDNQPKAYKIIKEG